MARRVGRSRFGQETIGFLLAKYVRLVQRTSRFTTVPADIDAHVAGQTPLICAMWHGQHLMMSFAWPDAIDRMAALISRHEDAGAQAAALQHLGVDAGARLGRARPTAQYYKGGVPAMRELLRQLESGASVAMTADVPKRARVAGLGIVTLAKLSGRPIVPTAVVTSRRVQFDTWDRATLGAAVRPRDRRRRRPHPRRRRRRRRRDGSGAARRAGGARRSASAGLRHGRRDRSGRESENGMTTPLSLHAYRLAHRARHAARRAVSHDAAQARQGRPAAGRRTPRPSRPFPSRGAARLAAWRERRRGRVAAALRRAHHPRRRERAGDDGNGHLGGAARAAPAGGSAASIRSARQPVLSAPVSRPLAARRGADRRIRALAEHDRRIEAGRLAARDDQRPDQRAVVRPLAQGAGPHRRAPVALRPLPRAQRERRRTAGGARRAPRPGRRRHQVRRAGAAGRPARTRRAFRPDLGAPDLDRRLDPRGRGTDRGARRTSA